LRRLFWRGVGWGESSSGGGTTAEDLTSAYNRINGGMSYDQVKDIVGRSHDVAGANGGNFGITYQWNADSGGDKEKAAGLAISIGSKGVFLKIIAYGLGSTRESQGKNQYYSAHAAP